MCARGCGEDGEGVEVTVDGKRNVRGKGAKGNTYEGGEVIRRRNVLR